MHASLRHAVDHGVLVTVEATGRFRFRHALLAEAVYSTILPGEREELHAKLAEELARSGAASAAELAPHWAAAGRSREALAASVEAARQAEAVFGLAEAHAHLERALALWPEVPDAAELVGLDLAALCTWAAGSRDWSATRRARSSSHVGRSSSPGTRTWHRAALLHVGIEDVLTRSAAAMPRSPRSSAPSSSRRPTSPERAFALGSLGRRVMLAWRHAESLRARRAGARDRPAIRGARGRGPSAHRTGHRARPPRARRRGPSHLHQARHLAEEIGDRPALNELTSTSPTR